MNKLTIDLSNCDIGTFDELEHVEFIMPAGIKVASVVAFRDLFLSLKSGFDSTATHYSINVGAQQKVME